jgi:hypothetical protein
MALQFEHNVEGEYARLDITYIYIYIDVKTCFYGPEMALVVNGTKALSAVAETHRSRRISKRERQ